MAKDKVRYAAVPPRAAADKRLKLNTLRVLIGLCRHADPTTGEAFPGLDKLVKNSGVDRKGVTVALKVLESCGYILRFKRIEGHRFGLTHYRILYTAPAQRAGSGPGTTTVVVGGPLPGGVSGGGPRTTTPAVDKSPAVGDGGGGGSGSGTTGVVVGDTPGVVVPGPHKQTIEQISPDPRARVSGPAPVDNSPGSSGELARVTARFAERALGHPRLSFEAWFHAVERVAAHASGPALDALIERAFEFDDPAAELVEQCERFERGASLSQ